MTAHRVLNGSDEVIEFGELVARDCPAPAPRWNGFPRYNFIGGHNDPAAVPVEALAEAAARVIRAEGAALATYNAGAGPLGNLRLRRAVALKLARQRGIEGTADDVLITSGSLQGLDLVNAMLLEPGDTVLMEQLTYSGAIDRVRARGVRVDGLSVADLEARLERMAGSGVRPKYIYTIPTIQNPTGTVMSVARRRALLAASERFGVPIFEDECYADLLWEGEWPAALRGMPGGAQVVHIRSFSKSVAPALRLGYVSAEPAVLGRLVALKSDGGTAALEQMILADFLGSRFDAHVAELKERLRHKLGGLVEALDESFGTAARLWVPKGGIFLWLTLPEEVDTAALATAAAAEGIAFNVGSAWATDETVARHSLRLCFALPPAADLREGVRRLAAVCQRETGIPRTSGNERFDGDARR